MGVERPRADIPEDPRAWRPQTAYRGRFRPAVHDPIYEPLWRGTRVLAFYVEGPDTSEWGTVEVCDAGGHDAGSLAPVALDMLRRSIDASEVLLDGIITRQSMDTGEGVAPVYMAPSPLRRLVSRVRSDIVVERRLAGAQREPGFVALDLLSIDGQHLLDVPLLERKRLLEGVIRETELVRLSPWVRPPVRNWFVTWRAAGFRGMMVKGANSRYVPGKESYEWTIVERMP
jgi:ATP-dependent DNA ligase